MLLLSFRQAVEQVRNEKAAAFAYCAFTDARATGTDPAPIGANLFVLTRCATREYCMHYIGGRYGTRSLGRERYGPDQIPNDARLANYQVLKEFDETLL